MKKEAKTYKREVTYFLLAIYAYVVYTDDVEMVNAIVWPTIAFAAGAFGFAAVNQFKQLR